MSDEQWRKKLRVLNLGAGVQSTAIYLMMIDGEIEPADVAIFADVKDEPQEVYTHLRRLQKLDGPEICIVSAGSIGDNLVSGVNATGQRYVSIPTFLQLGDTKGGMGRRQCTSEYKIRPIEKEIRVRMDATGRPLRSDQTVQQVFGLSFDEPRRVERVRAQFVKRSGWSAEFPLFDDMMTRADCLQYLEKRWGHPVPRSACVFCPYHSDDEWIRLKAAGGAEWARIVEIDHAIREETSIRTKGMNATQYLHRSCKPIDEVEFKPSADSGQQTFNWSQMDCEGMCGV